MLVNREELYKRIEKFMNEDDYYGEWEDYVGYLMKKILDIIENCPVPFYEKKYSQWKVFKDNKSAFLEYHCGKCGATFNNGDNEVERFSFCPCCGTEMIKYVKKV